MTAGGSTAVMVVRLTSSSTGYILVIGRSRWAPPKLLGGSYQGVGSGETLLSFQVKFSEPGDQVFWWLGQLL